MNNPDIPPIWDVTVIAAGLGLLILAVAALVLILLSKALSPVLKAVLAAVSLLVPLIGPLLGIAVVAVEKRRLYSQK
ncbi:hypothetical protein ACIPY2_18690 [Paenarthrobacter sp. NPDC089675]|uniref:hypothetical protein n=1 Tax=Paenarthrobacter sp. NPDC089675 TaxID=3364376 RepID=UPI00381374F6